MEALHASMQGSAPLNFTIFRRHCFSVDDMDIPSQNPTCEHHGLMDISLGMRL